MVLATKNECTVDWIVKLQNDDACFSGGFFPKIGQKRFNHTDCWKMYITENAKKSQN